MFNLKPLDLEEYADLKVGDRVKPKGQSAKGMSWTEATIKGFAKDPDPWKKKETDYFVLLHRMRWRPDTPLQRRVDEWVVIPGGVEVVHS